MFGYIRPDLPELKVKEYQRFKACYCGLCHTLGKKYGIVSRFTLNYDFVFMAMFLENNIDPPEYEMKRCPMSPFCKKCICAESQVLERSAGYSIILTYWKLCDSINDEHGWEKIKASVTRLALSKAYKKASAEYEFFDDIVRKQLGELDKIEKTGTKSIDQAADTFAQLLAGAAGYPDSSNQIFRIRYQVLYHMGRIIYISDAYQDIPDNFAKGTFNPIISKYSLTSSTVPNEIKEDIRLTLMNSQDMILSSYELMPKNYWDSIMRNILFDSMSDMISEVLKNSYNTKIRGLPKYPKPQIGGNK